MIALAPDLLSDRVRRSIEHSFAAQHAGSIAIGEVDLAWTTDQRIDGVVLMDPEERQVLRASLRLPPLGRMLEASLGEASETLVIRANITEAEVVVAPGAPSNLERALERRGQNDGSWIDLRTDAPTLWHFTCKSVDVADGHHDGARSAQVENLDFEIRSDPAKLHAELAAEVVEGKTRGSISLELVQEPRDMRFPRTNLDVKLAELPPTALARWLAPAVRAKLGAPVSVGISLRQPTTDAPGDLGVTVGVLGAKLEVRGNGRLGSVVAPDVWAAGDLVTDVTVDGELGSLPDDFWTRIAPAGHELAWGAQSGPIQVREASYGVREDPADLPAGETGPAWSATLELPDVTHRMPGTLGEAFGEHRWSDPVVELRRDVGGMVLAATGSRRSHGFAEEPAAGRLEIRDDGASRRVHVQFDKLDSVGVERACGLDWLPIAALLGPSANLELTLLGEHGGPRGIEVSLLGRAEIRGTAQLEDGEIVIGSGRQLSLHVVGDGAALLCERLVPVTRSPGIDDDAASATLTVQRLTWPLESSDWNAVADLKIDAALSPTAAIERLLSEPPEQPMRELLTEADLIVVGGVAYVQRVALGLGEEQAAWDGTVKLATGDVRFEGAMPLDLLDFDGLELGPLDEDFLWMKAGEAGVVPLVLEGRGRALRADLDPQFRIEVLEHSVDELTSLLNLGGEFASERLSGIWNLMGSDDEADAVDATAPVGAPETPTPPR